MQTSTQPEAVGVAPAPAPVQAPSITTVGPDGKTQTLIIPSTRTEVRELMSQREELADQLSSASSRRRELSEEVRTAPEGVSRTGLEERIRLLDSRILQLETEIALTGRQLAATPEELVASARVEGRGGDGGEFEEGFFGGGFLVAGAFAVVLFIRRWRSRRRGGKKTPAMIPTESNQRLERIEQGMEAIAIEVERVSEGQRFVTRLLSEQQAPIGVSHRVAQPAMVAKDPADADSR